MGTHLKLVRDPPCGTPIHSLRNTGVTLCQQYSNYMYVQSFDGNQVFLKYLFKLGLEVHIIFSVSH